MALSNYQKHHLDASIYLEFPDVTEKTSLPKLANMVRIFNNAIKDPEVNSSNFFTAQQILKDPNTIFDTLHGDQSEGGETATFEEARMYLIEFADKSFSEIAQSLEVTTGQIGWDKEALLEQVKAMPDNDMAILPLSAARREVMEEFELSRLQAAKITNAHLSFLEQGLPVDSNIIDNSNITDLHFHLYLELKSTPVRAATALSVNELYDRIADLTKEDIRKLTSPENIRKTKNLILNSGLTGKEALQRIDSTGLEQLQIPQNQNRNRPQPPFRTRSLQDNNRNQHRGPNHFR